MGICSYLDTKPHRQGSDLDAVCKESVDFIIEQFTNVLVNENRMWSGRGIYSRVVNVTDPDTRESEQMFRDIVRVTATRPIQRSWGPMGPPDSYLQSPECPTWTPA